MTSKEIQTITLLEITSPSESELGHPINITSNIPDTIRDGIYDKYKQHLPWKEVFSEIPDKDLAKKYIDLFEYLDNNG